MPELPEVETVVRTLEHQIEGRTITKVTIHYDKIILGNVKTFQKRLIGETFHRFERRGKYLIFRLTNVTLVSHLRMEGKYYIQKPSDPIDRHMHVIFDLDDGSQLRYHDTRKFGRMELFPIDADFTNYKELGPEPFWDTWNQSYVHQYRIHKKVPLKTLLLDQHFCAGIGNIYADEILAACHLRPGRSCQRITKKDEENIVYYTRDILSQAIQAGGTTIRSYTSSLGVTGRFQLSCSVHMQKICKRCGEEIQVKYIGGRSSYYCPHCQK